MSAKTDLEPTQKVALLKHLASGKSPDVVATIVGLPRNQVIDVASHHGFPDRDKLAWAADILAKKVDEDAATQAVRTGPLEHGLTIERGASAPPSPARPTAAPSVAPTAGGIEDLIATGKDHSSKRIQAAANKVLDDVDRLRNLLRDDEKKHAARRKAEREKAAARAEVERLEAQLAEAKAKLRGGKAPAKQAANAEGVPSAAEVRAWAAENDIQCPSVGRVPAAVRDAYDAAHVRAAS